MTHSTAASCTIRRAEEADRLGIEAIAARTWDGHDYLPRVIDTWLADSVGEFVVAVGASGEILGTGKLTCFGPGEWWLVGLRAHPDHYGQGIGGAINQYLTEAAEARIRGEFADTSAGHGVIRLCTNQSNSAVIQMMMHAGFAESGRYLRYQARAIASPGRAAEFRTLGIADLAQVRAYLDGSAYYQHAQRSSLARRWICRLLSDARLIAELDAGHVFAWHGRRNNPALMDGLLIIDEPGTHPDGQPEMTITYLDATPGNFAVLAQAARSLAASQSCKACWQMTLVRKERLVAVEQAGWRRPTDNSGRAILFTRVIQ